MENPLDILKEKLNRMGTKSTVSKVMTVVSVVEKSMKGIINTNLVNPDIQDLVVQYSGHLSRNKTESSI